jgi:LysR family transcriptional activator for leuABCD operon
MGHSDVKSESSKLKEINLRRLDLNLLTIFEAVYEEGSQQKAAERLSFSQPAISAAINKFRHATRDKLFVGNRQIRPTIRADEIYPQIKSALDIVRKELFLKQDFKPETTSREFSISLPYGGGFLLGETIFRKMRELSPHSALKIRSIDPEDEVPRMLRQQDLDLAITSGFYEDPMIRRETCLNFEIRLLVRKNHPRIQSAPTLEAVMAERFIWVAGASQNRGREAAEVQAFIDVAADRGDVEVPNIMVLPSILSKTDLLALVPTAYADMFKVAHDVESYEIPIAHRMDKTFMIWHKAYEDDPAIKWFREICEAAVEELRASGLTV